MCNRKSALCAVFLISVLLAALPFARAQGDAGEKSYIVQYAAGALRKGGSPRPCASELAERELQKLLADGVIEWYEEDYTVTLMDETPDDPTEGAWHLDAIKANAAREIGCLGQGVRVAVIDSGANAHEDLSGNLCEGYNYIDNTKDVTDNVGHGTFVGGLIAAEQNGIGIDGVAPQAKIVPLKCFDNGVQTKISQICTAIYDAIDLYHCDIINMSFGLQEESRPLKMAVDYAASSGVICTASVGNNGGTQIYYPAAFDAVIGVGATTRQGTIASFSQHNESVFVTAPGDEIQSLDAAGGYTQKNGTSFAAPIVAGMLADLKNLEPTMDAERAKEILRESADDLGDEGYDVYYGYGAVNMERAVTLLCSEPGLPGDLNADGVLNAKDVTFLRRHLAGGYGVDLEAELADVNHDGICNAKDVTYLRRYLAGGYGITLEAA